MLFLLDKEVADLPSWVFLPGLVICVVVILLAALGGRVALRSPLVVHRGASTESAHQAGVEPASSVGLHGPSIAPTSDPFEQANALQREWQGKQKRVAIARIAEELEAADQVLHSRDADYFFAEHSLSRAAWEEHGERLVEADLMALHKTVRAAYRALDALESQGIRRDMVTSSGRKIAGLDSNLLRAARVSVRTAIEDLSEGSMAPK